MHISYRLHSDFDRNPNETQKRTRRQLAKVVQALQTRNQRYYRRKEKQEGREEIQARNNES
jgi:hypothetical protein